VGILHYGRELSEDVTTQEVIEAVQALNVDALVHGILVQLPLPPHIDERAVIDSISPEKDVDGLTLGNLGRLFIKGLPPLFYPCTPLGCMELLKAYEVPVAGARAVVLGRSNIVGGPIAALLQSANATVTVCHSQTVDIEQITAQADILIACIGKPQFVKAHWIKPGCTIIDVGINSIKVGSKTKLVGDVDFEGCSRVAGRITPVPGGVGPMTVAMLMSNTVSSWRRSN
jgi:methylenetetrahydrofolate dehydrogenase (NADP+)/methenyltetrahydrofolate cyclohydrolase/formyltetrahydrofolate synthetase